MVKIVVRWLEDEVRRGIGGCGEWVVEGEVGSLDSCYSKAWDLLCSLEL